MSPARWLWLALFASGVSCAQVAAPPPPFTVEEFISGKSLRSPPASGATIGPLRVWFDETPLLAVVKTLGVGQIAHSGDAGNSRYWLCYAGRSPRPFRIWLISHGEMGGSDHRLTQIQAAAVPDSVATPGCPDLPARFERVSFAGGLWLGNTLAAWRARLGSPSFAEVGALSYSYVGKVTLRPSGSPVVFDRLNELRLFVQDQQVLGIIASQVTSY